MNGALRSVVGWWSERSSRERLLLTVMLALITVTALWYGAVQPLRRGVDAAAAARAESAAELAEAEVMASRIEAQRRRFGARGAPTSLENRIVASASQAGVILDRHQLNGGAVTVWIGAGDSKRVFSWLAALQGQHGIGVTDMTAIPGESGAIQVQATLTGPA